MQMSTKTTRLIIKQTRLASLGLAAAGCLFAAGCGANESVLRSGKESPPPAGQANIDTRTTFEKDLAEARSADFLFLYVIRRKDGAKLDEEDRKAIRLQTTDTNRRVSSDDGKAVIIGSNYQLPAANITALYTRFALDDYSRPPAANANSNSNK